MNDLGIYKLFKTPIGKYIYDANRNSLIKDAVLYDYLEGHVPYSNDICQRISKLNSEGYLTDTHPQKLMHNSAEEIEYHLSCKVNSLTLQLTQRCNFRCTYCIYSEDASPYQREHSNADMTIEQLESAIGFLFSHSKDVNSVNIGFYGGEPLLRFDLIKHAVSYIKKNYYGKKVSYNITTNGSLLNDEIIVFFIENGINPMISLDGPKEIHDKYRHFAANGKGTYDNVFSKLMYIKENYPQLFRKIKFSAVIDPQNNLEKTNDYLKKFYTNYNITPVMSMLSDSYSSQKNYISDDYFTKESNERIKTFLFALGYVDNGHVSPITISFVESICKLSDSFKELHSFSLQTSPGGPCIPGCARLMVSVDGTLYPCEHVSEKSEVMKIGNLDTGFDVKKVLQLLNVCQITEKECKACWAYHRCYQCAKFCDNMDSLSSQKRIMECRQVKRNVSTQIYSYLMLKELMEIKNEYTQIQENFCIPL